MRLHRGHSVILGLNAAAFIFFGFKWFFTPVAMATGLGIQLTNADAITDAQAIYGGLELGLGLFLAICAARPTLQFAGLLAASLTLSSLATTRGIGILLCPTAVTGATWELLTTDIIGAVLNTTVLLFAVRRLRSAAASPS